MSRTIHQAHTPKAARAKRCRHSFLVSHDMLRPRHRQAMTAAVVVCVQIAQRTLATHHQLCR